MGRKVIGSAEFLQSYKRVTGSIEELPAGFLQDEWLNQLVRKYTSYISAEHQVVPSDRELVSDAAEFLSRVRTLFSNKKNEELFADFLQDEGPELGSFMGVFLLHSGGIGGSLLMLQESLTMFLAVHSGKMSRQPDKNWKEYAKEVIKSFLCCLFIIDGAFLSPEQRRAIASFESGEAPLFLHL